MEQSIQLVGKRVKKQVAAEIGKSILDLALQHQVDWGFSCTRGTCARCRCFIESGSEYLEEITDAEYQRLSDEDLDAGYRLGCQAVIARAGDMIAVNKTYF